MGDRGAGSAPRYPAKPRHGHKIYPYLLRGLKIVEPAPRVGGRRDLHPDGVRASLSGGVHRLASRAVLAWRLSNTNDASLCAAALEEALLRFGKPRI